MTVRLSTALRNNLAGTTGFGATFSKGVIYIYSGPQPLSADHAVSGTLLGKVTVDGLPFSFGAATNGLNFAAPAGGTVSKAVENWRFTGLANGTAGWFRLMANATDDLADDSATPDNPRLDGSIGIANADLNLSNLAVTTGAPNTIDVFSFTIPAA